MQKDTRRLTSGLQKCNITAKNPSETGTETRQPAYCSLCPPPPWRNMQPLCHVKEIISKAVWVKWHISSGSCQFQGKLNKVKSYPDRKRKAISTEKGRGSCIILVLLRLFFIENMTLVCGVTILALHESNRPSAEAEKVTSFWWTRQGESSAASSIWQRKERKPTTQNFTLSLDIGGVNNTQKLFLNAFLNHRANEALLTKVFNYYIEILSEMAHTIS